MQGRQQPAEPDRTRPHHRSLEDSMYSHFPVLGLVASLCVAVSAQTTDPSVSPVAPPTSVLPSVASDSSTTPMAPVRKGLPNVAVLPFTGSSTLSASDLSSITSRFEAELMGTGAFRVLERRNVDAILREQGFQQSGACNTSDCQVEVGQLLGVERIVTGEITRLERLWSLNLRMVDVGSGAVVASHVLDIKGGLETVLRGGCPEMADILAGRKQPTSSRTVLAEERSNTWAWILGGAVVVAGGATAAVLLLQDDEAGATKPTPTRDVTISLETGK
jgi:TolB-like protein